MYEWQRYLNSLPFVSQSLIKYKKGWDDDKVGRDKRFPLALRKWVGILFLLSYRSKEYNFYRNRK